MAYRKNITLRFGPLVTLVVDVESAVESEGSLRTVCKGTGTTHAATGVKQILTCPDCGNTDNETFEKAAESAVLTPDEVKAAKDVAVGETNKIMTISVHPASDFAATTVQGKGLYYLTPAGNAFTPTYGLLVDALKRHPEAAMVTLFSPAGRPNLYQLTLFGDTLVLAERARSETVRITQQFAPSPDAGLVPLVDSLLTELSRPYDPADYVSGYAASLAALIATKPAEEVIDTKSTSGASKSLAPVLDLQAALAASLAAQTKPARKPRAKKPAA